MIDLNDVDQALCRWAEYVARREDGGLGYASQSIYRQIVNDPAMLAAVGANVVTPFAGVPVGVRDPADQDKIDLIERVVTREVEPSTKAVIMVWYLGRGTVDQRARDLGTTRRTLYRWIENARIAVASKIMEVLRGVRQTAFPVKMQHIPSAANDSCLTA
nr:hypothetical protein [uncultured Pseudogulbenkiania sp.]